MIEGARERKALTYLLLLSVVVGGSNQQRDRVFYNPAEGCSISFALV